MAEIAANAAEFTRQFPADPRVNRARGLVSRSRLVVALLDGQEPSVELKTLADEARRDSDVSKEDRYEIAFLSEVASETSRGGRDRSEWLQERKRTARTLIAEFPEMNGGYALLLQVAGRSESEAAEKLAWELIASQAAADTKAAALVLLERKALKGQTIGALASEVVGASSVFENAEGRPVIFYTWRPEDSGSIALAKELARRAPADAVIVGVNLSRDVPRAVAAAAELPGKQLYDCRGFDSPLVVRLRLTSTPLLYLADRKGVLRSTDAQNDLTAQIQNLEAGQ